MPTRATSIWLPRVMFESALIVASILVALGLDEWREDRQNQETIQHALSSFLSEVQRNQLKVEGNIPFNQGLRMVLAQHYRNDDVETVDEFVNMIESYDAVMLQSTAWETALATGALAKMEYDLVSALSLTYNLQNRYLAINRDGMAELTSPQNLADGRLDLSVYNSIRYLDAVIRMEAELSGTYDLAQVVIRSALISINEDLAETAEVRAGMLAPE